MPDPMNQLEALIDAIGLETVLVTISIVCNEKAEHIAVNWQDTATAKAWCAAGAKIANMADGIGL